MRLAKGTQHHSSSGGNQALFNWIGSQLGYKSMDDWYHATRDNIYKYNGAEILQSYNNSPAKALREIYPDHNWVVWKFYNVPTGYWKDTTHQRELLDWLHAQLGYK